VKILQVAVDIAEDVARRLQKNTAWLVLEDGFDFFRERENVVGELDGFQVPVVVEES